MLLMFVRLAMPVMALRLSVCRLMAVELVMHVMVVSLFCLLQCSCNVVPMASPMLVMFVFRSVESNSKEFIASRLQLTTG